MVDKLTFYLEVDELTVDELTVDELTLDELTCYLIFGSATKNLLIHLSQKLATIF